MKKWLFFIIVTLTTVTFISASVARNLEQKKLDLKKAYEVGAITKIEYDNSKDYLKNSDKDKDIKKKSKSTKQVKNSFKKNKKEEEEITLKKIDELGQIIKFDNTYYSKSMLKHLKKGCTGFKCQGSKAGQFLYKAFNRSKSYSQKNPGQMIKAMAMFEVFYSSKLWYAKKSIERFKEDDYKGLKLIFKKKDEDEIRSLFGINKGRKSMRTALGMTMETPSKEAINKFWLLGEFLDLGTGVENKKLSKDLKQRQIKLANYKSKIGKLKKKLQDDLDKKKDEK
jgi:hypothetical protein